MKTSLIKQIFDPLLMDSDTQDQLEAGVNINKSDNEQKHQDHLHVTATDTYLLP